MSHFARKGLAAACTVLVCLTFVACGSGGKRAEQPLAVELRIDGSVTTQVAGIQSAYVDGTSLLANLVVVRGGSFDAAVFRGSAAGYQFGSFEADPEISLPRRRRDSQAALVNLGVTLKQVMGVAAASPAVADSLERLPEGSAVGDALREAVEAVSSRSGERWAVVFSDGINNTDGEELPLGNADRTAQVLRAAVGNVDASGVNVAIIGIGMSKGEIGSTRANPLATAWNQVCRELHADSCWIEQEAVLPAVLTEVS